MIEDLNDNDWGTIFGEDKWYGGAPRPREPNLDNIHELLDAHSFTRESVQKILYIHHGQNDEEAWELLAEMEGGLLLWIKAGCDYTGWDCQAGGTALVGTAEQLLHEGPEAIPRDERAELLKKLTV